jgi:hypothetical protein
MGTGTQVDEELDKKTSQLLAMSLQGEGPVRYLVSASLDKKTGEVTDENATKIKNNWKGIQTPEQLKTTIETEKKKMLEEQLRPMLNDVGSGNSSFDMQQISGTVTAATSTWDAFKTMNPLAIVPALISLVSSSSYIRGFFLSLTNHDKYGSVGESIHRVQVENSVDKLVEQAKAGGIRVDRDELIAFYLDKPAEAKPTSAPATTTSASKPPTNNPAVDPSALVTPGSESAAVVQGSTHQSGDSTIIRPGAAAASVPAKLPESTRSPAAATPSGP